MEHFFPPNRPIYSVVNYSRQEFQSKYCNIFLAGTIEMGKSRDWQKDLYESLNKEDSDNIFVFNPRRPDFDITQKQSIHNSYFSGQVNWELDYLELSNIIIFDFEPNTMSPIAIGELCLFAKDKSKEIIVYCDEEYLRKGNIDIICERYNIKQVNTFANLKIELEKLISKWKQNKRK